MAEQMQMTVGDAVNELTRVSNVFRAAEKLKDVLQVVANLDGERNVIEKTIRDAEARRLPALRTADEAEAKLKEKQAKLQAFVGSFDQRKADATAKFQSELNALQVRYTEEEQRLSLKAAEQSRELNEQLQALVVKRSDLQKEVSELEIRLRELKERAASIVRA